jgi:hypothetical protein
MQTNIVPVAVFPSEANVLYIRSISFGPPPSYYYELQDVQVVEKTREVANPAYVPAVTDGLGSGAILQPAQGEPTITETYEDTVVTVLKNGNVSMTEEQWDNWQAGPASGDDDYQLDAISANLGLTRA